MTDRELLERAAKAAGIHPHDIECTWNPLTHDGDALRLAVKLGITIDLVDCSAYRRTTDRLIQEYWGGDYDPSYRRAIVRTAAEIGGTS